MAKMKKRGAVYGIIALMLGVAVYLNWSYVSTVSYTHLTLPTNSLV